MKYLTFSLCTWLLTAFLSSSNGQTVTGYTIEENNGTTNTSTFSGKQHESDVDVIMKWNKRMGGTEGKVYDLYNVNRPKEYNTWEQTNTGLKHTHVKVKPYNDTYEYGKRLQNAQEVIDNGLFTTPNKSMIRTDGFKQTKPKVEQDNYDYLFK